jgi:hypothetical protein
MLVTYCCGHGKNFHTIEFIKTKALTNKMTTMFNRVANATICLLI